MHLDRLRRFCTDDRRVSLYFTRTTFPPQYCPFQWGDLDPHLIHGSLGPPKSSTQTAYRSVQPFLQGSTLWQTDQQTDRPTDHATRSVTIGRTSIFLSFFFLFFSSPNLSRGRLDVYHTSPHSVALVRIYNVGLKYAERGSLKIQDARNRQKFAMEH